LTRLPSTDAPPPEEAFDGIMPFDEVRRRTTAGAAVVLTRGLLVGVVMFAGTLVLARLLVPHDFGVVAIGTTVLVFTTFLADGGIGATLIRRAEVPEREELESVLGFQLVGMTGLAVLVAAVAAPFGEIGLVTAVMTASLPLTALRTPGVVLLERELAYRPLTLVEVLETVAHYAWAITTVALGWGVWGLATAFVVRAATGTAVMLAVAPIRALRPRLLWARVRPLLGFGLRFQAAGGVVLVRDQALAVATAVIGGVALLGLWTLARRLVEIGYLLYRPLWRVSYPAMSRLLATGEDPRPVLERSVGLLAAGGGLLIVPLLGFFPAFVPAALGARWSEATDVLPWGAAGLLLTGSVGTATVGYLWAAGDARTPLRAYILEALVWGAVAAGLMPVLGLTALGVGWLAGAACFALVLGRRVAHDVGASIWPPLLPPALVTFLVGVPAWAVSSVGDGSIAKAVVIAVLAEGIYVAALFLVRRRVVVDLFGLAGRALRLSLARAPEL